MTRSIPSVAALVRGTEVSAYLDKLVCEHPGLERIDAADFLKWTRQSLTPVGLAPYRRLMHPLRPALAEILDLCRRWEKRGRMAPPVPDATSPADVLARTTLAEAVRFRAAEGSSDLSRDGNARAALNLLARRPAVGEVSLLEMIDEPDFGIGLLRSKATVKASTLRFVLQACASVIFRTYGVDVAIGTYGPFDLARQGDAPLDPFAVFDEDFVHLPPRRKLDCVLAAMPSETAACFVARFGLDGLGRRSKREIGAMPPLVGLGGREVERWFARLVGPPEVDGILAEWIDARFDEVMALVRARGAPTTDAADPLTVMAAWAVSNSPRWEYERAYVIAGEAGRDHPSFEDWMQATDRGEAPAP